jgi:hypothetical protein
VDEGGRGVWDKEAYILEIIKLMGYVDSKADPRTVTTHQNKTNSAILQTAISLKKKVQN